MKILSLWQPWASLWVGGEKRIETRSWGTSYRGLIAVHASKRWDEDMGANCRYDPFRSALERLGFTDAPMGHRSSLPFGAILGYVRLVDCLSMAAVSQLVGVNAGYINIERGVDQRLTPRERAFGNYAPGRYAWITEPMTVLGTPLPYRGAQGLRDLPVDVEERLDT